MEKKARLLLFTWHICAVCEELLVQGCSMPVNTITMANLRDTFGTAFLTFSFIIGGWSYDGGQCWFLHVQLCDKPKICFVYLCYQEVIESAMQVKDNTFCYTVSIQNTGMVVRGWGKIEKCRTCAFTSGVGKDRDTFAQNGHSDRTHGHSVAAECHDLAFVSSSLQICGVLQGFEGVSRSDFSPFPDSTFIFSVWNFCHIRGHIGVSVIAMICCHYTFQSFPHFSDRSFGLQNLGGEMPTKFYTYLNNLSCQYRTF